MMTIILIDIMNNDSNHIHKLLKSLKRHIQVNDMLINLNSRICLPIIIFLLCGILPGWCRKGVNQ